MYKLTTYLGVFIVTSFWDYIWQLFARKKLHICINEDHKLLCPSKWEWIKIGEQYFKQHSTLGAMAIAGICGVYALTLIDYINTSFVLDRRPGFGQLLVVFFASWVVGFPMRYSSDPLHTYLFGNLRKYYYKPLGFWWSSYTDAQSGIIVVLTFKIIEKLISC